MENITIIDKLLRAMRYLWRPGNILYWGMTALAAILLGLHELRQIQALENLILSKGLPPDASEAAIMAMVLEARQTLTFPWHLWLFNLLASFLLLCKSFDGIMRLSEGLEDAPVPYAPTSLVSIFLPLKYFIGILLWVIFLMPLFFLFKPGVWGVIAAIFFWFFTPAMIMNLIGNNSLPAMLSPVAWLHTIRNVGIVNYLAILLLPLLPLILAGMLAGFAGWFAQSPAFFIVITSLLQSYGIALLWIYCGYFMREDREEGLSDAARAILAEADTRAMSDAEQQQFAQDMLAVDLLIEEGADSGIEELLRPYSQRDIATWFPAYRRLYDYQRKRGGRDTLQNLENRLFAAAAQSDAPGNARIYRHIHDSLHRVAEHAPERLEADWIQPLAQLASQHGHDDTVLRLTHRFSARHPGHKDLFANYSLAARALDRQGNTATALQLLQQLLARYPDHPRAAQAKRTCDQWRHKLTPTPPEAS